MEAALNERAYIIYFSISVIYDGAKPCERMNI